MTEDRGWELDNNHFKVNIKTMPNEKEVQKINEG